MIQRDVQLGDEGNVEAWKPGRLGWTQKPSQKDFSLTQRIYSRHAGANSILSPSSRVNDSYFLLERAIQKNFHVQIDDLYPCKRNARDSVIYVKVSEAAPQGVEFGVKATSTLAVELLNQSQDDYHLRVYCKYRDRKFPF